MVAPASAPASLPDAGRFAALDALRGVAALAIAWRHINGSGPLLSGPLHDNLSLGVDFFFVLSGFVISASYGDRLAAGFSTLRYMALRIGRVWPLHAAIVGAYLVLELVFAAAGAGVLEGREPFTGPRDPWALPGVLLLVQAVAWPGRDLWNVQSWSISVEVLLYLAAALAWRWIGPRAWLPAALVALAALIALDAGVETQHWLLRGIGGFGLGMAAFALWRRGWVQALPRAAVVGLEFALVPAAVVLLFSASPLAADFVFALAVLVFAREEGPISAVLRSAPLVWLGTVSYSLYMVHGLVFGRIVDALAFAQNLTGDRWVSAQLGGLDLILLPPLPATLLALAMLAALLPCAWLAWRLIEWPARQWSRRAAARYGAADEERAAPTI